MTTFTPTPPWHYRRNFVINLLITIFLTLVQFARSQEITLEYFSLLFVFTAIYSNCIGFLVGYTYHLSFVNPRSLAATTGKRLVAINVLFLAAGLIGSYLAHFLILLLIPERFLPQQIRILRPVELLIYSLLSGFFGNLIFVYDFLRSRWERVIAQLKEKEVLQERLEKLKAEAELSALQARIQPHFLFNTLNSIAALVRENPELAEQVIERLAGLFRYSLASHRNKLVTLKQELSFVQDYLEIEKVRLGRRLRFTLDADAASDGVVLPGLLVQPLVENCVRHAIGAREEGGEIIVRARTRAGRCAIEVLDDGAGPGTSAGGSGYALENIRGRLEILYGSGYELSLQQLAGGGTRVLLEIPVEPGPSS